MTFADEDGEAVAGGEGFDGGRSAGDAGGANEDHFERAAVELCRCGEDGGVDLATVGVAFYGDVECSERCLGRMFDVAGEQDAAGAGSEGGRGLNEGFEGVEEVVALKKFEHGGGFAAGHDETIDAGELSGDTDELWYCAE